MSETLVRNAVKELLVDNSNLFVSGLETQGNPRVIHQISKSQLTPPTGYYYINIYVTTVDVEDNPKFKTTSIPPSQAIYSINIEISDYAYQAIDDEDQLFEKMDGEFQLLTDRIVAKIRESRWITDNSTSKEFKLYNSRRVSKNNLSTSWEEASQYHALLYSRITFQVIDECTDDVNLYT